MDTPEEINLTPPEESKPLKKRDIGVCGPIYIIGGSYDSAMHTALLAARMKDDNLIIVDSITDLPEGYVKDADGFAQFTKPRPTPLFPIEIVQPLRYSGDDKPIGRSRSQRRKAERKLKKNKRR